MLAGRRGDRNEATASSSRCSGGRGRAGGVAFVARAQQREAGDRVFEQWVPRNPTPTG